MAIEGYTALRGGGEGGGKGGGVDTSLHHTTIAFNMADFTLFKYTRSDGLNFATGSSFQILGNENRGKRLVVEKWWGGIYKSSTLRNSRFGFLALFVNHVSLKENGSLLCVYLCMNLRLEYFTKFSNGNIPDCLKSGLV